MTYLAVLLLTPVVWHHWSLATDLEGVPLGVAWAGALGGTLRSLDGLFFHGFEGWEHRYDFWHFCSPFVGIAMGIVTYLIVTAGLLAAGGSGSKPGSSVAVLVAVFIAAYNGDQFRALVRKTGDGLFGTPSTRSADPTRLPGPASGEAGTPKLTDTSTPPSEHGETPPPSGK